MRSRFLVLVLLAFVCAALAAPANANSWQPDERTVHYTITGTTGPALYASIGDNGPEPSIGVRAIAYTDWDLRWRRDYQPDGDGCRLASARPFLMITYNLPRPSAQLTGTTARNWQVFYDGMAEHEDFHGVLLRQMTNRIIEDTVGLRASNDPDCQKVRQMVLERVKAAFQAYNQQSAEFDRIDMSPGGNVHRLILQLVNGG